MMTLKNIDLYIWYIFFKKLFVIELDVTTRAQAKKIFSQLMGDVVFEKAMHKYLSPTVIRNIQRTLDTIRKSRWN